MMEIRRSAWVLGLLLIGACGGGDDDEASNNTPPPPPPAAPSVAIGVPVAVNVAPVAGGGNAESGAVSLDFNVAAPGNYRCIAHGVQGTEVRDAQMAIMQGATELARDDDSGEGFDSMITRQLAAGAYTIRVWEWQSRDASITVTCSIAPVAPAAPSVLVAGTPAVVNVVAGQGPGSQVDLNFVVPAAATYQCDATTTGFDAQVAIVQNGAVLQQDDDSGEGFNARLTRPLTPGAYQVRVWEWQHRAAAITINCAVAAAGPVVANNGVLTLAAPATVNIPAGEGAAGQVHLNLVIPAQGSYTCDATSTLDAQMAIVQAGAVLVQDSDSGEGTNSRITRDLAPGAYQIRLWEWLHRATQITVTCRPGA